MLAPALVRNVGRIIEIPTARSLSQDWWKLSAAYALGGNRRFPLPVRLRDGEQFYFLNRGEVAVFWQIFVCRCYDVQPGDRVILDAGANVGLFAVWAAKQAPQSRIISAEPHPTTFERLQQTIRMNGLAERVDAVPCALGGTSAERWLNDAEDGSISNYMDNLDRQQVRGRRMVQCATLADLMHKHELEQVDLLKMDIEASEYETLLATPVTVLRKIARMNVELHVPGPVSEEQRSRLLEYLRKAGFKLQQYHPDRYGTGIAYFERV